MIKNILLLNNRFKDILIIIFLLFTALLNRLWLLPNIIDSVFRGVPNFYGWMALWNCRILDTLNFGNYWATNAMYPYSHALTFSETMTGFTPFIYPIWKITGNPVLTVNILSILFLWLVASITYFVLRGFDFDRFSSIVASIIFAFYPWVLKLSSLGRFHMQGLVWMPIIVYANYKFWRTYKRKYLILVFVFYLWTFLFSLYYGVFFTVFLGLWNIFWFFFERERFDAKKIIQWGITVFLVWLVMLPIFLTYQSVSSEMGAERSLENQIQYTGPVWSWLTVPDENWLWGQKLRFLPRGTRDGVIENFMFPGFIVSLLFIFIMFYKRFPKWLRGIKWTVFSIFIFSIGPFVLGLPIKIPMPFTALWYLFPPMKATRNPHRFAVFVILGLVFLIAFVLNEFNKKKKISLLLKTIFIALLLLESFTVEKATKAIKKTTPIIYGQLNKSKEKNILVELPMTMEINLKALTYSSFHWQKLINGTSDYYPPLLGYLNRKLQDFPSAYTVELLKALSVDRIIIHEKKYNPTRRVAMFKKMRKSKDFKFITKSFGKSLWALKKGKKFIPFVPKRDIEIIHKINKDGKLNLSITIPKAEKSILFNSVAPFHSKFFSSKKWFVKIVFYDKAGKLTINNVEWKATPIFSRLNYLKNISVIIPKNSSKVDVSIIIMGKTTKTKVINLQRNFIHKGDLKDE